MASKRTADALLRVAVVDDDEDTRLYSRDILQAGEDFRFAGDFANATDALNGMPRLQPDLALMDIRMPDLNGIECTRRLKRTLPHLKIIIITGRHDENSLQCSSQAGADAYLIKPVSGDQCPATLRFTAVRRTEFKLNPEKSEQNFSPTMSAENCLPIRPRENEVLKNLADGLLYKEISDKLGIALQTDQVAAQIRKLLKSPLSGYGKG